MDPELTTPSRFGGGACEADETLFTCCRMTTGVFVGQWEGWIAGVGVAVKMVWTGSLG